MDFGNYLKVIVESINSNFFSFYNKKKKFEWKSHRLESVVVHKLQSNEDNV